MGIVGSAAGWTSTLNSLLSTLSFSPQAVLLNPTLARPQELSHFSHNDPIVDILFLPFCLDFMI